MAVEQHRVGALAGDVDEDHRRPGLEADHLQRGALQPHDLAAGPALEQLDRLVHVAVGGPIGVEGRRFVGDPDVVDQGGDHLLVPEPVDEIADVGEAGGGVLLGHGPARLLRPATLGASAQADKPAANSSLQYSCANGKVQKHERKTTTALAASFPAGYDLLDRPVEGLSRRQSSCPLVEYGS